MAWLSLAEAETENPHTVEQPKSKPVSKKYQVDVQFLLSELCRQ